MSPAPSHAYTSGVFDMFHIGHLNLLEAASQQCGYLTVAVATDRLAQQLKGFLPVIPLLERMEIVAAMSMVDNVVVQEDLDKVTAWNELHFDVIFAGDNWAGHPRWVQTESDLARLGVRTVFLPYTRTTSSETLLRAQLGQFDLEG